MSLSLTWALVQDSRWQLGVLLPSPSLACDGFSVIPCFPQPGWCFHGLGVFMPWKRVSGGQRCMPARGCSGSWRRRSRPWEQGLSWLRRSPSAPSWAGCLASFCFYFLSCNMGRVPRRSLSRLNGKGKVHVLDESSARGERSVDGSSGT